jgi:hypothetical protein
MLTIKQHQCEVFPLLPFSIEQAEVVEGLRGAGHEIAFRCRSLLDEIESLGYYALLRGCIDVCSHGLIPLIVSVMGKGLWVMGGRLLCRVPDRFYLNVVVMVKGYSVLRRSPKGRYLK